METFAHLLHSLSETDVSLMIEILVSDLHPSFKLAYGAGEEIYLNIHDLKESTWKKIEKLSA
jgi:hypothetical protein